MRCWCGFIAVLPEMEPTLHNVHWEPWIFRGSQILQLFQKENIDDRSGIVYNKIIQYCNYA